MTILRKTLAKGLALVSGALVAHGAYGLTPDDGKALLDSMLQERIDYVVKRGEPISDPEQIEKEAVNIFFTFLYPSHPHGPPPPPTKEQEIEYSRQLQAKAEAGGIWEQFALGQRYLFGKGLPVDKKRGADWITKAAETGQVEAAFVLAKMHERGVYVAVDKLKAIRLYQMSAEKGYLTQLAAERLGEIFEFGLGVQADYSKAMEYYRIAADRGAEEDDSVGSFRQSADFKVGRLYAQGKGVPRDYDKAKVWFFSATNKGRGYGGMVPEAECAMAILYATGLAVPKDDAQRDFWLNRPNAQGMKVCQTLLQKALFGD